ncbi:MAG TPA: hypothetical protein ENI05_13275 [Porticoccus sp.]|nr:hypothetical protein [Porticoccus sp.]
MKFKNLLSVIAVSVTSLVSVSQVSADIVTIGIEAYVDGSSTLNIQHDSVWWDHYTFSAPGEWIHHTNEAGPLPTMIGNTAWYPDWSDCNPNATPPCRSSTVVGEIEPLGMVMGYQVLEGRSPVSFVLPSINNNDILSIVFDDIFGGASWYSIELTYSVAEQNVSEIPVPATAWLFGSALIGLTGVRRLKR